MSSTESAIYDAGVTASQTVTPVFIFSLPRSGSTLLQRMLAGHPAVATASEPWLLLPILMARRTSGTYSVYRHEDAALAIEEFVRNLPEGQAAFDSALRDFLTNLYRASAGPGPRYFVDKTPRYHMIAHEIMHLFPQAKFVFLWRNPISVASSIIRTWGNGNWNLFRYRIDLEHGPHNLVAAYGAHSQTAIAIQYEELVRDPQSVSKQLFEYLELDYLSPDEFGGVELKGSLGDHTGIRYGASISTDSLAAWSELGSPLRKILLRRYLHRLGDETLETMGYQRAALLQSLAEVPNHLREVPGDIARLAYGVAYRGFDSVLAWRTNRYLHGAGRTPLAPPSCRREVSW